MLRYHLGISLQLAGVMPVSGSTKNEGRGETAKTNGEEESSNSEGESSSYDDEESERRKVDCLDDMQYLEQQFSDLKELLYHEKVEELDLKIQQVNKGHAEELLHPQQDLRQSLQKQLDRIELQHKCCANSIENKFQEEVQSAQQDFEELVKVTKQRMLNEVEERVSRLKEDVVIARLSAESTSRRRRSKISPFRFLEKRKKPVTVTGPYVVYMLRDMDIMEDIGDIRKGRASLEVRQRKQREKTPSNNWRTY